MTLLCGSTHPQIFHCCSRNYRAWQHPNGMGSLGCFVGTTWHRCGSFSHPTVREQQQESSNIKGRWERPGPTQSQMPGPDKGFCGAWGANGCRSRWVWSTWAQVGILSSRETSSQPVGRSARSDVLLQNMLLRINWFPLRWLKPSEKLPTGPIANRSWFALCQKCYVLSLIIRHPVEEPPLW